ncbi:hypothetical protein FOZ63_033071, partial [Perkinsus olseni]
ALAKALHNFLHLKTLDIPYNYIGKILGDEGAEAIARSLAKAEPGKSCGSLVKLVLFSNSIGMIGGRSLVAACETNFTLLSLAIDQNPIPDDQLVALQNAVSFNNQFEKLIASSARFEDFGHTLMAETLQKWAARGAQVSAALCIAIQNVLVGDKCYEDLAMPFGAPSSCWNYCRLSSKAHRVQHRIAELASPASVIRGLIYIDDAAWFLPAEGFFDALVCLLIVLPLMGLKIAWAKCRYGTRVMKFIGFLVDFQRKDAIIRVPEGKLDKILQALRHIASRSPQGVPVKEIESICGRLNWVSMTCHFTGCFIAPLYSLTKTGKAKNLRTVKLSPSSEAMRAISWWIDVLSTGKAGKEYFRLVLPLTPRLGTDNVRIGTDASLTGLRGWASYRDTTVWFKIDLPAPHALNEWRQLLVCAHELQSDDVVLLETLAGVIGLDTALVAFEHNISERTSVTLFTDNTGTRHVLTKFKSRTPRINKVLQAVAGRLAKICYRWGVEYRDLPTTLPEASLKAGDKSSKRLRAVTSVAEAGPDELHHCVSTFIRSGHARATQDQYDSIERFYIETVSSAAEAFPVTGRTLGLFAWAMCKAEYKYSSISSYLSAIVSRNGSYGHSLSKADEFQLRMIRRAAEKVTDAEIRQMLPLSKEQVVQIGALDPTRDDPSINFFLVAIYGRLRPDEGVQLNRDDMALTTILGTSVAQLTLRSSKTDPTGRGQTVIISCVKDSPASGACEPHCAYHRLLTIYDGGGPGPSPLFQEHKERVPYEELLKRFRATLVRIGNPY